MQHDMQKIYKEKSKDKIYYVSTFYKNSYIPVSGLNSELKLDMMSF